MKILHTSDWHLGHRLHNQDQSEELQLFLDWLLVQCEIQEVDVLLVSGDIFDTHNPSQSAQEMYYNFLVALKGKTKCQEVVITGGNHDAPGFLNAPKSILKSLNIHVVGKATENIEDELMCLQVDDEKLWVGAVPFLRDQDVRRAVFGESHEDIASKYKAGIHKHYEALGELLEEQKKEKDVAIAMGHLFAVNAEVSDSEKDIHVGNLGAVSADSFPEIFDYVALGHIHRPQKVGGNERVQYSGSPVYLSFSESRGKGKKRVILLETQDGKIIDKKYMEVPVFRELITIKGNIEEIKEQIENLNHEESLKPFVEVISTEMKKGLNEWVRDNIDEEEYAVLAVRIEQKDAVQAFQSSMINGKVSLKEISPKEVFEELIDKQPEKPENMDWIHQQFQLLVEEVGQNK